MSVRARMAPARPEGRRKLRPPCDLPSLQNAPLGSTQAIRAHGEGAPGADVMARVSSNTERSVLDTLGVESAPAGIQTRIAPLSRQALYSP